MPDNNKEKELAEAYNYYANQIDNLKNYLYQELRINISNKDPLAAQFLINNIYGNKIAGLVNQVDLYHQGIKESTTRLEHTFNNQKQELENLTQKQQQFMHDELVKIGNVIANKANSIIQEKASNIIQDFKENNELENKIIMLLYAIFSASIISLIASLACVFYIIIK